MCSTRMKEQKTVLPGKIPVDWFPLRRHFERGKLQNHFFLSLLMQQIQSYYGYDVLFDWSLELCKVGNKSSHAIIFFLFVNQSGKSSVDRKRDDAAAAKMSLGEIICRFKQIQISFIFPTTNDCADCRHNLKFENIFTPCKFFNKT